MDDKTTWNVLLTGQIIDTVVYDSSFSKTQVKNDLVDKGYSKSIKLEKTHW
jgi:hypothetical protein